MVGKQSIHLPFCGQTNYIFHIRLLKHKLNKWNEKIISLFLNMAEDHGMIKKVDLSDMYQESVGEQIYQKMLTDSQALLKIFPEVIKKETKVFQMKL